MVVLRTILVGLWFLAFPIVGPILFVFNRNGFDEWIEWGRKGPPE